MTTDVHAEGSKTELKAAWLGVAGVELSDGETTLLFDPVVTKPKLNHWFTGAKFDSNLEKVKELVHKEGIKRTQGIFISHTHFDHAVDAGNISGETGAKVYGGESVEQLMKYNGLPNSYAKISENTPIVIGQFKVTPIRRTHPPIFSLFSFLPGPIEKSFSGNFYEYREGEVWCYWVEHPAANILIDQGSHFLETNSKYSERADYYFVGVANKKSVHDVVMNNIAVIQPQFVIPLHYDYFLTDHEALDGVSMPGMNLEGIQQELRENVLKTKWLAPKKFEIFTLKKY